MWQDIKSLSTVEPKGFLFKFQQQMFAEKKLFYCFAERFVFHELRCENGIIHHVEGTEQTRDKNFSSGSSEYKRTGNHWKRRGKKLYVYARDMCIYMWKYTY